MSKYERLFEYIPYFEDNKSVYCAWQTAGTANKNEIPGCYPEYDTMLQQFISLVQQTDLTILDYLEHIQEQAVQTDDANKAIQTADIKTVKALLTYYIRQERFCDGLWEKAAKEGIFLSILHRLRQLTAQD